MHRKVIQINVTGAGGIDRDVLDRSVQGNPAGANNAQGAIAGSADVSINPAGRLKLPKPTLPTDISVTLITLAPESDSANFSLV